ncbi:MAG: triose-phosphate isomerase [Rhodospirillaceae bacterium]|nr:triose-phosphate isomerase [Rhodospirillaceae bacterium]
MSDKNFIVLNDPGKPKMTHQLIIAGNWKMNLLRDGSRKLISDLQKGYTFGSAMKVILIPPATLLGSIADQIRNSPFFLGAQNCHEERFGAFTGEVSAEMLADLGCKYVILGHSERRTLFGETNNQISARASAALDFGLTAIICVGESIEQRQAGLAMDTVSKQLEECVGSEANSNNCIIAYEPIWAIGTGKTAELQDIEEMHRHIRNVLIAKSATGNDIPILYGGSVKAENASNIFAVPQVGGALVGGASLNSQDFLEIIKAGQRND